VSASGDRVGEVWADKPRGRGAVPRYPFQIVGCVDLQPVHARARALGVEAGDTPWLWVGLTRTIFGEPFLFTIAEDVLRRAHRRITDHERSTA
jgi:hypothetical protein